MAAIPSSGSLIATHDYYRRRIGSTSSNSSCGSSEYTGEVIPHPPGLARQDSGHWWSSFFFGKQNQMGTLNGFESHAPTLPQANVRTSAQTLMCLYESVKLLFHAKDRFYKYERCRGF
uniref:Pancreatic progenitor cell differentiation and proliferation factor A-like n=1 Tax=Sinocyclocheilus grahami TaxID=75366 RepID=A0A672P6J9_SINGR